MNGKPLVYWSEANGLFFLLSFDPFQNKTVKKLTKWKFNYVRPQHNCLIVILFYDEKVVAIVNGQININAADCICRNGLTI